LFHLASRRNQVCFPFIGSRGFLQRIEYLQTSCGLNMAGIKLIIDLAQEVDT
jgi:hypothetical protein